MTALAQRGAVAFQALLDRPTPIVKQSATALGLVAALVIVALAPDVRLFEPIVAWAGITILVLATALAVVFTVNPRLEHLALIVPAADIVGLGFFRAGTGGSASLFTALILFPVIWLAASDGRRYVVYAGVGTSLALMMPYLLTWTLPATPTDWLRGIFAPGVFAVVAGIVNELARQSREQLKAIERLADEKETMLQRTVEYAAQLQESETRLRATDRMFRSVWGAVTEQSVIATDPEGLIEAWNPGATKLLGPSQDDMEDRGHVFDFHLAEELEAYAKELGYPPGATVLNPGFSALVERARQGLAENREWTYVRSDGTHVPVLVSVTARNDEAGRLRGYLFVASDQTKAREVAKLKDDFVGLISHELRTPLSSILGYLELMRDDTEHPLSEEQVQYLGVAERNANRLLRLVGDLLFTAQVESGRFPLDLQEIDLGPIVAAAVETAVPVAEQAGVTLSARLPDAPVRLRVDPTRLGQAVDNLISNAIKFTPRDGTVTVSVEAGDTQARIEVRDTGMGIPRDELEQLFSRFFRASTATRNAVPGVGLGLVITKAIVLALGGTIDVDSVEGQGTAFTITLPVVA